jgi:hypothetical protein
LLRDVLDQHSLTIQTANLQWNRQYDDELQHLDERNPSDAPSWSYIVQEDTNLNSYYNYNTKDREEVEDRTNDKTDEEAEREEAEDAEADYEEAYDSI